MNLQKENDQKEQCGDLESDFNHGRQQVEQVRKAYGSPSPPSNQNRQRLARIDGADSSRGAEGPSHLEWLEAQAAIRHSQDIVSRLTEQLVQARSDLTASNEENASLRAQVTALRLIVGGGQANAFVFQTSGSTDSPPPLLLTRTNDERQRGRRQRNEGGPSVGPSSITATNVSPDLAAASELHELLTSGTGSDTSDHRHPSVAAAAPTDDDLHIRPAQERNDTSDCLTDELTRSHSSLTSSLSLASLLEELRLDVDQDRDQVSRSSSKMMTFDVDSLDVLKARYIQKTSVFEPPTEVAVVQDSGHTN